MGTFEQIIQAAKSSGKPKRLALPFSKDGNMEVLSRAAREGLIIPVLIGEIKKIQDYMSKSFPSLKYEIIHVEKKADALRAAIDSVREGRADMLMRGDFNQNRFLGAVLDPKSGLLKGKLASYICLFQLMKREKIVLITDTYINNFPGIGEKQVILEQAIALAGLLGIECPKIAALAAIEQVNPSIPSTLDAGALSKMGERRQFGKAIVEGPLDMDCALSQTAADRKGIKSIVTGNVDIYIVPEIDTGYLLAQALIFFSRMKKIGFLQGMAKPVVFNLPLTTSENMLAEIALACLSCGTGGSNG